MWRVPAPQDTAQNTFTLCVDNVEDPQLRARLQGVLNEVIAASTDFAGRAPLADLHNMPRPTSIGDRITKKEMTWVYDNRMVGGPGRAVYNRLKAAAVKGVCPLCGIRDATTLDHHLAKSQVIALAVTPQNLVPSCKECNTSQKPPFPVSPETNMIHPYYDNIEGDRWLRARTVQSSQVTTDPAPFVFYVDPPSNWSSVLAARVRNHFDVLSLSELYASKAAGRLVGLRYANSETFYCDGAVGVRNELARAYRSYEFESLNSWETALFHAASEDEWFCSGGFGLLSPSVFGL